MTDEEKAKQDDFFASMKAAKDAEEDEEARAEARLAAMDEETRAAYLKEKADKEAHEKEKSKMLANQMKRYSTLQGGGASGKKGRARRAGATRRRRRRAG